MLVEHLAQHLYDDGRDADVDEAAVLTDPQFHADCHDRLIGREHLQERGFRLMAFYREIDEAHRLPGGAESCSRMRNKPSRMLFSISVISRLILAEPFPLPPS